MDRLVTRRPRRDIPPKTRRGRRVSMPGRVIRGKDRGYGFGSLRFRRSTDPLRLMRLLAAIQFSITCREEAQNAQECRTV
jgi:hypothetical protein